MFQLNEAQMRSWLSIIELDVTEFCNLGCVSCCRGCDQFPTDRSLSLDIVKQFVQESIELNYHWHRIGLLGGEPTLHPMFRELIQLLRPYKELHPQCDIWLMTNGTVWQKVPEWLRLVVNTNHSYHHAFYVSPKDEGLWGTNRRCECVSKCGIGLGNYGYTPCILGTTMCRLFGYKGIRHLKDCTPDRLMKMFEEHCQHCGWYLVDSDDRSKGVIFNYPKNYMSNTWVKLREKWDAKMRGPTAESVLRLLSTRGQIPK